MLDAKDREKIALKKFAIIAPVLNGQVPCQKEYFEKVCAQEIEMPHYGDRVYTPKTLLSWLNNYRKSGLDGLRPGSRSDRGKSRKVTDQITAKAQEKSAQNPKLTGIMLYEELVKDGVILPEKLSLATFYRFLSANPQLAAGKEQEEKELKRFSHQWVNELWQTDIMYGPYLKVGKAKKQTYLIAFIDDASRLITGASFSYSQNFSAMREVFREAVLKRGVPRVLYTDNGKIYRCGQMALLCAGIGCHLIHAEPFSPNSKGKVERFFRTVRLRFLSGLELNSVKSLEDLNLRFWHWLEEDYQRKNHSALNMSPLDFFMSQVDRINVFSQPALLYECFLLRVERKVNHDATFSLENVLYETDQKFANIRIEVRYEPQWLSLPARPLFLYKDGLKIGEARQVNFQDNARVKRRGKGRPAKLKSPDIQSDGREDDFLNLNSESGPVSSISFTSIMEEKTVKISDSDNCNEKKAGTGGEC